MLRQAGGDGPGIQHAQGTVLVKATEKTDPVYFPQVPREKGAVSADFQLQIQIELEVVERWVLKKRSPRLIGHVHHTGFLRVIGNRSARKHHHAPQAAIQRTQALPHDLATLKQQAPGLHRVHLAIQQGA